jgi:hypothetical protein
MRDYWLTQAVLGAVGWTYLILAAVALALTVWLPKQRGVKVLSFLAVLALVSILPLRGYRAIVEQQRAADEFKDQYAKAKALFDERCKSAGEKIYRKTAPVSEILLVNPRQAGSLSVDIADPKWPNAGFPLESTGIQYVMEFLYFYQPPDGLRSGALTPSGGGIPGYRHVHVVENGIHVRYSLRRPETHRGRADPLESYGVRQKVDEPIPRYAVEYENIPDPEGRASWIAGGRVKVTDRVTGELLGEFVRYSIEPGLGSTDGSRQPWAFARWCPQGKYPGSTGHVRMFVQQILIPDGGQR